ncbi:6,7-dimethyl-8-ribityllumazine synthase [Circinella umbellata]|nr:6,7-dimethyl-8-ribityllumazine synthase [Circinella umbellata]
MLRKNEKASEEGVSDPTQRLDYFGLRICIVHTRWNYALVEYMYKSVYETLIHKYGDTVSGPYELPMAAKQLIDASKAQASSTASDLLGSPALANKKKPNKKTGPFDAVICIGIVIKGGTAHFEYVCDAVTQGIMRVQVGTGVPVNFGVLTCYNDDQAIARSSTEECFPHSEE